MKYTVVVAVLASLAAVQGQQGQGSGAKAGAGAGALRKDKRGLQPLGGATAETFDPFAAYSSPYGGSSFGSVYGSPYGSIYGSASPYGAGAAFAPLQYAAPAAAVPYGQALGPILKQTAYGPFGARYGAYGAGAGFPKFGYNAAYSSAPFGVQDNGYPGYSGYQAGYGGLALPLSVPTSLSYSDNAY